MQKKLRNFIKFCSSICLYSFCYLNAYAEDILKGPTKDVFDTFKDTGINILLLVEILTAAYIFSTKERSIKTWLGIPILILVTAYAKTKFAGQG